MTEEEKPKEPIQEPQVEHVNISFRRRVSEGEHGTLLWLITFTDIMALMLTFFVLLYSMSVPKEKEWNEITRGVTNQFTRTFSAPMNRGTQNTLSINKIDFSEALDLVYLHSVLDNAVQRDERLRKVHLIPQKSQLILSVPNELIFESGEAVVSEKGRHVLFSLGNVLARIRNRVEVIGHADPRPVGSADGQFSSNWMLSLVRAGSVAWTLENAGYDRPVVVRGLSSARYEDLPPEISEEDRLFLARRVDIVVMEDDGEEKGSGVDLGLPFAE